MKHIFILLSLILSGFFAKDINAQVVLPCDSSRPFCSDSTYNFPNNFGATFSAPAGPNYGCLATQPNPIWYHFQIENSGTLDMSIVQTSTTGNNLDVDFALWGPFTSLEEGCEQIMSGTLTPLQCSYSASNTEQIGIGVSGGTGTGTSTPPAAQAGEIYIVILTNYSGLSGQISFSQTGGDGTTNCGLVCNLSLSSNSPICQNDTLKLFANADPEATFQWSGPNGFVSTQKEPKIIANTPGTFTYTCTRIINEDSCTLEQQVTIHPVYNTNLEQSICAGKSYNFLGEEIQVPGTYTKSFTTVSGCDSTFNLNLSINPLPEVKITADQLNICEGETVSLEAAYPNEANTYQWYRNNYPISEATSYKHTTSTAGTYRFTAESSAGCIDSSKQMTLTINPAANAEILDLDYNKTKICIGDTILFKARKYADYQFSWSPESYFRTLDGFKSSEARAVVTPNTSITLKATNKFGCTDEAVLDLYPVPCCDVMSPTVFSPNGDGRNDYFNIMMQPGQKVLSFQVFNRFGNIVYNNNNSQKGWNGRDTKGNNLEQGTYYYRILYTCTDNTTSEKKGDIVLVR